MDRQGSSRQDKKAAAELKADNLLGPNHHHQQSREHLLLPLRNHQDTHCTEQDHEEPAHTVIRTRRRPTADRLPDLLTARIRAALMQTKQSLYCIIG